MQTFNIPIKLFLLILLFGLNNVLLLAQNPGESCDPDQSAGHMARLGSFTGTVTIVDMNGSHKPASLGTAIQPGSTIQTSSGSSVVLFLEDGTQERSSRLLLNEMSEASFRKGGLYCSDLRPIADDGRWSSRELELDLLTGSMRFEIAEPVSYSFNTVIRTNNSVATMQRNRNETVVIEVVSGDIGTRSMVPVMEHPVIKRHISGMLFGRSLNDLNASEQRAIKQHAVITAISMEYMDLEAEGYLNHPQAGPMVQMMTRGRSFGELDQQEKDMIAQAVGAILVDGGHINPDEVMIYDEPDERSVFRVHSGRFRLYNSHLGYSRDRVVICETGTIFEVRGYGEPTPVL
ncbi:MAG: hypothetical protein EA359_04485 [Balneolaceae bacterium]|nr:MAG: hypothetical protein EA359_04485 [Balneolaceae bacterium]